MRSGNPALTAKTFEDLAHTGERMSLAGTVNKTAMLLVLALATAAWTWDKFYTLPQPEAMLPYLLTGALGGLAVALVTVFFKKLAPFTAPAYALLEGLVIGSLSAILEAKFPGIVLQAVGLTFGTLAALLIAYRSGYVRATENFKLGVVAATGGICLLYLVDLALMFSGNRIAFIHESGFWGIAFSLFVVLIAALNLVLDFDFIESGVANGSPKYMEWYSAFGLVVTLIWLYLEILRLLGKSRK